MKTIASGPGIRRIVTGAVLLTVYLTTSPAARQPEIPASAEREGMVLITASTFEMGTDESDIPDLMKRYEMPVRDVFIGESPKHKVTLSPFYIDRFEVSNSQFKDFVDSNSRWARSRASKEFESPDYLKHWENNTVPKGFGDHPVTYITWAAAYAYCSSVGKRLPTEAEWEYAARGGLENSEFPWGNSLSANKANYSESGIETTTKVGSYRPNAYGIHDLAGNVWEFVADELGDYPEAHQKNPVAGGVFPDGNAFTKVTSRRVIRGGSWGGAPVNLRVRYRDSHRPNDPKPFVGFRCAADSDRSGPNSL